MENYTLQHQLTIISAGGRVEHSAQRKITVLTGRLRIIAHDPALRRRRRTTSLLARKVSRQNSKDNCNDYDNEKRQRQREQKTMERQGQR